MYNIFHIDSNFNTIVDLLAPNEPYYNYCLMTMFYDPHDIVSIQQPYIQDYLERFYTVGKAFNFNVFILSNVKISRVVSRFHYTRTSTTFSRYSIEQKRYIRSCISWQKQHTFHHKKLRQFDFIGDNYLII